MKLRATWMPLFNPVIEGFNKRLGSIWITWDDDETRGTIGINFSSPVEGSGRNGYADYFASIKVYHDGIDILEELRERGFLSMFATKRASTFYDVFDCLHSCQIPVLSHDSDLELIANRKMYELLTTKESA